MSAWLVVAAIAMATVSGVPGLGVTWDCGYAAPSPRMQNTSSPFAETFVRMFSWALRPDRHATQLSDPFPPAAAWR
jgi:hydrogenase-4 component B